MAQRHIRNLDAVRAIAILLVMAFHGRYLAFGWIGVWVFFVLSGFLITRSLIPLLDVSVGQGLRTFYLRRSLRIWPAYYLYLGAVTLLILAGISSRDLWPQLGLAAVYGYNFATFFGEGGNRIFGHLWSLAVEEQYYLIIAPVLLLTGRRFNMALFLAGVFVVPLARYIAFGALQSSYGETSAGSLVQMLTPFQLDSFMLGGLLAFREDLLVSLSRTRFLLCAAAIVLVAGGALVANDLVLASHGQLGRLGPNLDFSEIATWRLSATSLGLGVGSTENFGYAWIYSAIALLSFVAIACVIRFMQNVHVPVLNAIGRVSYGMYLYHALLVSVMDRAIMRFAIPKHSMRGMACFAVLVLVTWCISAASFKWVEQPFLRLKDRYRAQSRANIPVLYKLDPLSRLASSPPSAKPSPASFTQSQ